MLITPLRGNKQKHLRDMSKFKKGDRVRVVKISSFDVQRNVRIGDTGVIITEHYFPFIRMDKYNKHLSEAQGRCEQGYGYATHENDLELIEEETSTQRVMTPMQEAIDKVQSLKEIDAVINPIDVITTILKQMLEKEKQVIMDAVDYGPDYNKSIDYYNETFNTKEK